MKKVAKFEKISLKQFVSDWLDTFGNYDDNTLIEIYNKIKLPKRATVGSAGYDFCSPVEFVLRPGESIKIPTGLKCKIDDGWMLQCYPRSGLGFKYRLRLNNTVGIIDSDFYNSNGEGHIFLKFGNESNEDKTIHVYAGNKIAQGIFVEYGITYNDEADGVRSGGFGSTGK